MWAPGEKLPSGLKATRVTISELNGDDCYRALKNYREIITCSRTARNSEELEVWEGWAKIYELLSTRDDKLDRSEPALRSYQEMLDNWGRKLCTVWHDVIVVGVINHFFLSSVFSIILLGVLC